MNLEILKKLNEYLIHKREIFKQVDSIIDYFESLKGKQFYYNKKRYKLLNIYFHEHYVFSGRVVYIEVNADGSDKYKHFKWTKEENMSNYDFFNNLCVNTIKVIR